MIIGEAPGFRRRKVGQNISEVSWEFIGKNAFSNQY